MSAITLTNVSLKALTDSKITRRCTRPPTALRSFLSSLAAAGELIVRPVRAASLPLEATV